MEPGDAALFYPDGLLDAKADGQLFDDDGLRDCLAGSAGAPAPDLIARLQDVLTGFDQPMRDDIAMLAISVPADA